MVAEEEQVRLLRWEGCYNSRDLGGYRTADGRETRWRAIVRSDNLIRLTEAGRRALLDYGIRTIVDLRLPNELADFPSPFATAEDYPEITYLNLSFIDISVGSSETEPESLAADYIGLLGTFQHRVAEIMSAVARAREGGVLVHCHAGKDRTGLVCAVLLDLVGVERETVAADYALSQECLRAETENWLANGPGERAERERAVEKSAPRAEVMLEVLEHLEEAYGGVEGYLLEAGVLPEDLDRLRSRLLGETEECRLAG